MDLSHLFSSPWQPHTNGLAERSIQSITQQLRVWTEQGNDWDKFISKVCITHNHTYQAAIGRSPASYIFEEPHKIPVSDILPTSITDVWRIGNPNFKAYPKNAEVLAKRKFIGNRTSYKLMSRYHGPYKIVTVRSKGVMYDVINEENGETLNGIHYEDLRLFYRPKTWLTRLASYRTYFDAWWNKSFGELEKDILDPPEEYFERSDFESSPSEKSQL